jgi:hypothetical protein
MITKDGKYETVINDYGPKPPTITVISHEEPPYDSVPRSSKSMGMGGGVPPPLPPHGQAFGPPGSYQYTSRGLPRQGSSSLESGSGGVTAPVHVHTVECSQRGHVPQHPPHGTGGRAGSPPEPAYCDFHCCALHEEGRKIQVNEILSRQTLITQYTVLRLLKYKVQSISSSSPARLQFCNLCFVPYTYKCTHR